jgi:hypothetical protein
MKDLIGITKQQSLSLKLDELSLSLCDLFLTDRNRHCLYLGTRNKCSHYVIIWEK